MADEEKTMEELANEEENVMTKEEFEELEEEEGGIDVDELGGEAEEEEVTEEAGRMDRLIMRVDKVEAQLETLRDEREVFNERFQNVSEQIGELRSSLVSESEDLDELDQRFSKIRNIFEEMEPGEFDKKLEKKETEITQNQANIEEVREQVRSLRGKIDEVDNKLGGIKNIENLVELSDKIEDKMEKIKENKNYTDRKAAKVENIFSELSGRLNKMRNFRETVEKNKETITELMKTVDKASMEAEKAVSEDDLDELKKDLRKDIDNVESELEGKVYEMSDLIDEFMSRVQDTDLSEISSEHKNMRKTVNRLFEENEKLIKRQKMMLDLLKKLAGEE